MYFDSDEAILTIHSEAKVSTRRLCTSLSSRSISRNSRLPDMEKLENNINFQCSNRNTIRKFSELFLILTCSPQFCMQTKTPACKPGVAFLYIVIHSCAIKNSVSVLSLTVGLVFDDLYKSRRSGGLRFLGGLPV